jgi:hypothetical protein
MFPYYFFYLPPSSSTPRGPIDTKSFSTRETMGKFVLVKFESNRSKRFLLIVGERKVGQTDAQTDIILKISLTCLGDLKT